MREKTMYGQSNQICVIIPAVSNDFLASMKTENKSAKKKGEQNNNNNNNNKKKRKERKYRQYKKM
jgi:hypothetical protein